MEAELTIAPPKAGTSGKRPVRSTTDNSRCNALLLLVTEVAEQLNVPDTTYGIRVGEAYSVRSLVVLLAYCYCHGVYSSRDAEGVCFEDRQVAGLFEGHPPDWKTLRRFRRVHRGLLQQCMLQILERALAVRFGDAECTPTDACVAQALDRWFEPICVPHPEREAGDRIDRAVFVDGMILD